MKKKIKNKKLTKVRTSEKSQLQDKDIEQKFKKLKVPKIVLDAEKAKN